MKRERSGFGRGVSGVLAAVLGCAPLAAVAAGGLVSEHRITATADRAESTPVLGLDATGPYVAFRREDAAERTDAWVQRLDASGAPVGDAFRVAPPGDSCLPFSPGYPAGLVDASEHRVLFSCSPEAQWVHDLATAATTTLNAPEGAGDPAIFGDHVALIAGGLDAPRGFWLCDLATDPTCASAELLLSSELLHSSGLDLGSRLAGWRTAAAAGDAAAYAYDRELEVLWELEVMVLASVSPASTSGAWMVWSHDDGIRLVNDQQVPENAAVHAWDVDTQELRTLASSDAAPKVDGSTVAWACGGLCVTDLATDASFTGTTGVPVDEVGSVLGDLVAFTSGGDVWVARISFEAAEDPAAALDAVADAFAALPATAFRNPNQAHAMASKLAAIGRMIEHGDLAGALEKLRHDVLAKTDGCAADGAADGNDWIRSCADQGTVHPAVLEAIDALERR